jgi:hypothetical protein
MPREAKLFASSAGSVVRAFLKFRANMPPRWIKNARASRKRRTGNRVSTRHVKASSEEPAERARGHQDGWRELTDSVESFGDAAQQAIPPGAIFGPRQLTRVRRKVNLCTSAGGSTHDSIATATWL